MTKFIFNVLSTSFLIIFTFLFVSSKGRLLFAIGGSLGFIALIGINYYISSIKKEYIIPLRIVSLISWILIALSFIAYKELISGLTSEIIISSVILVVILDFLICLLIFQFIRKPDISSPESIELWKQGVSLLYLRLLIPLSIYIGGTIVILWSEKNTNLILEHKIRLLPIIFQIIIISMIFSTLKLKKDAFRFFLTRRTDISEIKEAYKKFFRNILVFIILLNMFVEGIRGMYFFNFLTWMLFFLILLFIYRFLENLSMQPLENINKSEVNLDMLPSLTNPKFIFKTLIFHTIVGTIYVVSLGLLIILWGRI